MRRIRPDAVTVELDRLLPEAIDHLNSGGTEYRPPAWVANLWANPREIRFSGKAGANLLEKWRGQTEAEMKTIVQREDWGLLRVLGILRRLPTDYFFLGERLEEDAPRRFDPHLADVAEWAAMKYARHDATRTSLKAWTEGPTGFGYDEPEVDRESLAEIMALTRLASRQFGHLGNVRKTLARGGETIFHADGTMDSRQSPELQRRFDLHDRRGQRFSFYGSTAGTFNPAGGGEEDRLGSLLYMGRTSWREDEGRDDWRYEGLRRTIPKADKRFVVSEIRLRPLYDHLSLLEDVVLEQYGLAPEVIIASLMSLSKCLLYFLCAGFEPETLEPDRLAFLDRRGYLVVGEGIMDTAVLGQLAYEAHKHAFPDSTRHGDPESFAHGFKRLAYLDSYDSENISLEDGHPWVRIDETQTVPMPRPFVYPIGSEAFVVDLYALGDFVRGLFDCLRPGDRPGKRVSKNLEVRLDGYLGAELDHPKAFPTGQELWHRTSGGRKEKVAEIDVSFMIGSVLVIVDAKSIVLSPGYRRYFYGALKRRWKKLEAYVEKADGQAEKLARHPRGTNYDLLAGGYTHIVTLLCTAMPEYIDTDDDGFYLSDGLPRIATPHELRGFLAETTEADLKALPFAKRVVV